MTQCTEQVPVQGMQFHRLKQCSNAATTEKDGKPVCSVHSHEGRQKAAERKAANFEAKRAISRAMFAAHLRRKKM